MNPSLVAKRNGTLFFTSNGRWLYPLFELEEACLHSNISPSDLCVEDSIGGIAAAGMMLHLGVRDVHIHILSRLGLDYFRQHGITPGWDQLVDKISCKTEEMLSGTMTPEEIYIFLKKRAGLTGGIPVDIEELHVGYGRHKVLNGLSLHMDAGETLIIRGSNGSGKTTLLRSLLGLQPIATGSIRLNGESIQSPDWNKHRWMCGYVHQGQVTNDFPISAREVIEIGLSGKAAKKEEAAAKIEIAARRTGAFPLLDRPFHELSGGEKQRVNLARCLCQDARLILLDEPSSYLDKEGRAVLKELLEEMSRTVIPTILLVSHDADWTTALGWPERSLEGGQLC
ncbi:DUF1893 domain-containing protein [Sediminispirochaeta smaragdinae]|uniref:ABC transporter related protein n=1 Tax=Sediminispirochaeta smaragdinae (strain DSM 11293 / JCM 15392 / SEBR 4228) TaxID=573413 RepID=E1RBY4_SEDSS|nr:DUF1893 domain-containing protein [Sediminispirochaeta smaragdinae]ADK79864.1 ABC transporter related protein [Sediminispirochaeta smaragdinae DSM 11293]